MDTIQDTTQDERLEKTQATDTTVGESGTGKKESGTSKIGGFPWRLLAVMDCGDRFCPREGHIRNNHVPNEAVKAIFGPWPSRISP